MKVFPVKTLREQATSLEAAVAAVLAEAKPRHVHRLRTSSRRMEGTLTLLSLLPGTPEHATRAKKVNRRLRRLRRAAGAVRDLDVQIQMVEAQGEVGGGKGLGGEIHELMHKLHRRREREGEALLSAVKREQKRLGTQVKRLLAVLAPAGDRGISEAEMIAAIRSWVAYRSEEIRERKRMTADDRLHDLRKTAKLGRYIAESRPEASNGLRRLAREYEIVQGAGGLWHDWWTLERIARRVLGASSALAKIFRRECASSLKSFEEALAGDPASALEPRS